jgi:hypothetical protein
MKGARLSLQIWLFRLAILSASSTLGRDGEHQLGQAYDELLRDGFAWAVESSGAKRPVDDSDDDSDSDDDIDEFVVPKEVSTTDGSRKGRCILVRFLAKFARYYYASSSALRPLLRASRGRKVVSVIIEPVQDPSSMPRKMIYNLTPPACLISLLVSGHACFTKRI